MQSFHMEAKQITECAKTTEFVLETGQMIELVTNPTVQMSVKSKIKMQALLEDAACNKIFFIIKFR